MKQEHHSAHTRSRQTKKHQHNFWGTLVHSHIPQCKNVYWWPVKYFSILFNVMNNYTYKTKMGCVCMNSSPFHMILTIFLVNVADGSLQTQNGWMQRNCFRQKAMNMEPSLSDTVRAREESILFQVRKHIFSLLLVIKKYTFAFCYAECSLLLFQDQFLLISTHWLNWFECNYSLTSLLPRGTAHLGAKSLLPRSRTVL